MATSVRVGRRRRGSSCSSLGGWLAWPVVGFLVGSPAAMVMRQRAPLVVVLVLSGLALAWVLVWRFSMPGRATQVLLGLGAGDDENRPRVRRMWRRGPVWHVAWRMAIGGTVVALQHHPRGNVA